MTGIYFLKHDGEVVYVGQSSDIKRRIKEHQKKGRIFDDYSAIECKKELLNSTEEAYILMFSPILNKKRAEISVNKKAPKKVYIYNSSGNTQIEVYKKTRALAKAKAKKAGVPMKTYIHLALENATDVNLKKDS